MARIRTIKPDFFRHEALQDLEQSHPGSCVMLVFAGLWGHCDSKGRFEWRPRQLKLDILPFLSFDMAETLDLLMRAGLIIRYEAGRREYGEVPSFGKHQRLSGKEMTDGERFPERTEESTVKHSGSASDATGKHQGSNGEIPESQEGKGREDEGNKAISYEIAPARPEVEQPPQLALVEPSKAKTLPDCPHQAVLALWAEVLPQLPQHLPSQWRGARADHLRARWRETAAEKAWTTPEQGLAYLRKFFAYVGQSPFLTGRVPPRQGKRPFVAELEWLVNPTNWAKVHEGKYHTEEAA